MQKRCASKAGEERKIRFGERAANMTREEAFEMLFIKVSTAQSIYRDD